MNNRRSRCVEAVGLLHLIPGVMVLLGLSFFLWLTGLPVVLSCVSAAEGNELAAVVLILFGVSATVPALFAIPFFFLGLGLLRRRAWARFVALYMAFGLAGTGLLMFVAQDSAWGVPLLLYASPTLAVLLLPRFAREFE